MTPEELRSLNNKLVIDFKKETTLRFLGDVFTQKESNQLLMLIVASLSIVDEQVLHEILTVDSYECFNEKELIQRFIDTMNHVSEILG